MKAPFLTVRMISILSSIRPNPRYVPGGTENFWISEQTGCQNNVKMADTQMAEEKGKESEVVSRKCSLGISMKKDTGVQFPKGGILKNVLELKFYN